MSNRWLENVYFVDNSKTVLNIYSRWFIKDDLYTQRSLINYHFKDNTFKLIKELFKELF